MCRAADGAPLCINHAEQNIPRALYFISPFDFHRQKYAARRVYARGEAREFCAGGEFFILFLSFCAAAKTILHDVIV
ncbi:hypothetical protein [uncultured Cloacibacillus sp.]|uniref:hypothetical protein n=1 Tax=uncultured Cloacibacillus sp. TaxID=889794 RepID=UPI00262F0940|nr:hypothetical protein [uncultured Cloacibacillus sp.]